MHRQNAINKLSRKNSIIAIDAHSSSISDSNKSNSFDNEISSDNKILFEKLLENDLKKAFYSTAGQKQFDHVNSKNKDIMQNEFFKDDDYRVVLSVGCQKVFSF